MQVNEAFPATRKLFADRLRPVYRDFERDLGKELIDEAVKALASSGGRQAEGRGC